MNMTRGPYKECDKRLVLGSIILCIDGSPLVQSADNVWQKLLVYRGSPVAYTLDHFGVPYDGRPLGGD